MTTTVTLAAAQVLLLLPLLHTAATTTISTSTSSCATSSCRSSSSSSKGSNRSYNNSNNNSNSNSNSSGSSRLHSGSITRINWAWRSRKNGSGNISEFCLSHLYWSRLSIIYKCFSSFEGDCVSFNPFVKECSSLRSYSCELVSFTEVNLQVGSCCWWTPRGGTIQSCSTR